MNEIRKCNYPEKKGKCIVCGKKGLVSDTPVWWTNEHCYECVGVKIDNPTRD